MPVSIIPTLNFSKMYESSGPYQGRILHYQFRALPFRLSSAPCICMKVLGETLGALRKVPYLDDLLLAQSAQVLSSHLQCTQAWLQYLGWLMNFQKSNLIPSQVLPYLGYEINTRLGKIFLPSQKRLIMEVSLLQQSDFNSLRNLLWV